MENDKISSNERKTLVFKYMIQFFELYGNENFGSSAEVNWYKVREYCDACDMLDFNEELENLVYNITSEEFRDKVFEYVENQVLLGYPVWRLFKMNKWLYNKFEEELHQKVHLKNVKYFNKCKCYNCKFYKPKLNVTYETSVYKINMDTVYDFSKFKEKAKSTKGFKLKTVQHIPYCKKREELLEKMKEEYESKNNTNHISRRKIEDLETKFDYKRFRRINNFDEDKPFILNPAYFSRCIYFEKDESMTPEKFEEKYYEIVRFLKDDEEEETFDMF